MIKDKLTLYKSYDHLNIRCYSCNYFNHLAINCPMVHVVINPMRILKEYTKSFDQIRNLKYVRSIRFKINAFEIIKKSIKAVKKIKNSSYVSPIHSVSHTNYNNSHYEKINYNNSNNYYNSNYNNNNSSEFAKVFDFENHDNFICSIEDFVGLEDNKKLDYDFLELPSDKLSIEESLEKTSENQNSLKSDYIKKENEKIALTNKQLLLYINQDFHSSFEKMKNFEVYFIHNNASLFLENSKNKLEKQLSLVVSNIMKKLKKTSEKEKKLSFQDIFSAQKMKFDSYTEFKNKTMEQIACSSPNKVFNKKLRMKAHGFSEEVKSIAKIMEFSKKIIKKTKWVCFSCKKSKKL